MKSSALNLNLNTKICILNIFKKDFNSNRPNNREECIVKSSKSRLELDITEKVAEDAFKWFNSISLGASPARHKFGDKSLSTYTIVNGGESFYTQKAIGLNKSPEGDSS